MDAGLAGGTGGRRIGHSVSHGSPVWEPALNQTGKAAAEQEKLELMLGDKVI